MFGRELRAGLARLLGGGLDEPLGVGSVGHLFSALSRAAPASTRFQPHTDLGRLQAEPPEDWLGHAAGTEECEEDVLRADRIVTQPAGLIPRLGERLLAALAQRVRLNAGCRIGGQSGLASSISMIGMPSSTAYTRRQA